MKAISLWQPWASAIALGYKTIETRHWQTSHCGPLAIHAAKRMTRAEQEFITNLRFRGIPMPYELPLGAIVAIAQLDCCQRTENVRPHLAGVELLFGNYEPGRFAWRFSNIVALPSPIPYRGAQGFFDVPDELLTSPSSGDRTK